MIRSIVLALLLFCQSINIGRCLRENGTHVEISEAAQRHRLRRSLTFPDPSMLLLTPRLGTEEFTADTGAHICTGCCRCIAALAAHAGLIFGLGTPLQLDRESVIVGVFAKMQYYLPNNATDFTEPGVYYMRASRSRWSLYKMFEKVAVMYGFGGKECLLRAICEVAYVPFDVHHGLLGQLVHAFLRPSSTREEYDEYGDREYRAAERLGEQAEGAGCHALYPECRRSVLDVFSTLST